MEYRELLAKLEKIGQQHILKGWEQLSILQKQQLASQIEALNGDCFKAQQRLIIEKSSDNMASHPRPIEPFLEFSESGNQHDFKSGKQLLAQGKVGCLLIAGGQGTRLRFEGPKGMFPVSVVKAKSLFQLFAEKTVAAGRQVGQLLPLAIMTSTLNHQSTLQFFQKNNFFGLEPQQLYFFSQENLPFLDRNQNLFLENFGCLASGPDGNGSSLQHFIKSGIWEKWWDRGVRYLNYVLIDNPLADPFDAELIGFNHRQELDVAIKCTLRRSVDEKVGLLVKEEGKVGVVEYTELAEEERLAITATGQLKHCCANLSLFGFEMLFIRQLLSQQELPLHAVFKSAKFLAPDGLSKQAEEPIAWKFEKYIFDILPAARKVKALLYPRENCFAPLKNFSGEASLLDVKLALQNYDRRVFAEISGYLPNEGPFELAQEFHYPTPELLRKWKGRAPPHSSYVDG